MRQAASWLFVLALVVSSCGGGDDSEAATSAPPESSAPATTAPGGSDDGDGGDVTTTGAPPTTADVGDGSTTDFCAYVGDLDESQEVIDDSFDPDTFRASIEAALEALDRARDLAPAEIRNDVEVVAGTFEDFAELLEEYDYDLMAIAVGAPDDPRFLAFDGEEIVAASERIGAFCGIDLDDGAGGDEPPSGGASGDGGEAGGLVDVLTPPGVTETLDMGNDTILFRSDASFGEVADFYLEAIGGALFVNDDEESAVWRTDFEGVGITVNVSGQDGGVEILLAVVG
jgi:hypothetical protein